MIIFIIITIITTLKMHHSIERINKVLIIAIIITIDTSGSQTGAPGPSWDNKEATREHNRSIPY